MAILGTTLAACSQKPPAADWALNAESASDRATQAYLRADQRVQARRGPVGRTGIRGGDVGVVPALGKPVVEREPVGGDDVGPLDVRPAQRPNDLRGKQCPAVRIGGGQVLEFDACAAEKLPLADPSQLAPLLGAIESYGADVQEAETLINAYQYVIVARRTR